MRPKIIYSNTVSAISRKKLCLYHIGEYLVPDFQYINYIWQNLPMCCAQDLKLSSFTDSHVIEVHVVSVLHILILHDIWTHYA